VQEQDAPDSEFGVRGLLAGSASAPRRSFRRKIRSMARKPNYPFERMERERLKAAKVAEKARAKAEARERARLEAGGAPAPSSDNDDQG
jgi:hypothetical protein